MKSFYKSELLSLEISYITNTGRYRRRNEDSISIATDVFSCISMEKPSYKVLTLNPPVFLAVADGMGGHPCGDKASSLALEILTKETPLKVEDLGSALEKAKNAFEDYVSKKGECFGMGTVVAGVYLYPEYLIAFNVGDCRVYGFRDRLEKITKDHSLLQELLDRGFVEHDIENLYIRNVVTSAIIGGYSEKPKFFGVKKELKKGDVFLICSDGLWGEVESQEIESFIKTGIKEAGNKLFAKAYSKGSDNISFIVFKVL